MLMQTPSKLSSSTRARCYSYYHGILELWGAWKVIRASNFQVLSCEDWDVTEVPRRMRQKRKWRPTSPAPIPPAPSWTQPLTSVRTFEYRWPSKKGFSANRNVQIHLLTKLLVTETRIQGPPLLRVTLHFILGWVLLPSHPGISNIAERRHPRNPTFQDNFLQCSLLALVFF